MNFSKFSNKLSTTAVVVTRDTRGGMGPKKQRIDGGSPNAGTYVSNPYKEEMSELRASMTKEFKGDYWNAHDFFSCKKELRHKMWKVLDDKGLDLVEKWAWACPDRRALNIISHYAPIIEIGCGKGYWARLLGDICNVDIVAYDKYIDIPRCHTKVLVGGPEVLKQQKNINRTLLLCYPDENEAIAAECLDNFKGDIIIHIGEMMVGDGTLFGVPQAPFGRTSSADFQVSLQESFHQILVCELLNRFPYSKDCISVWKRTQMVVGKDHAEHIDNVGGNEPVEAVKATKSSKKENKKGKNSSSASGSVEFMSIDDLKLLRESGLDQQYGENPEEAMYAHIPADELLPTDRVALCVPQALIVPIN